MSRKSTRAVAVLATTLGIPAAIFAAALPASAAVKVCESNSVYCVGAPSLSPGAPVDETVSGRDINLLHQTGGDWKIQFNADLPECVAAADNRMTVVMHACNGGDGTLWLKHAVTGDTEWESNEFPGLYLSGLANGTQFQVNPTKVKGLFFKFTD